MGRYKNFDASNRLCKCCTLQEVENEQHFLLTCPLYETARMIYITDVSSTVKYFDKLNIIEQFIYIMSCENDKIISATADFIHKCNTTRLQFLSNN